KPGEDVGDCLLREFVWRGGEDFLGDLAECFRPAGSVAVKSAPKGIHHTAGSSVRRSGYCVSGREVGGIGSGRDLVRGRRDAGASDEGEGSLVDVEELVQVVAVAFRVE